jgi:hypothetical protein
MHTKRKIKQLKIADYKKPNKRTVKERRGFNGTMETL